MISIQKERKRRIVGFKNRKSRTFDGEAESVEASNAIWYEILSRLPIKTLVISKCVCKAWRDFGRHILVQQRRIIRVKRISRMFDGEAKSMEGNNDMWYEILSRLPMKSLVISKCVCKTWRDICCYILVRLRKMPFLSTRGVLFTVWRYSYGNKVIGNDIYLIYVPLTTKDVVWRIDSRRHNIVNYGDNEQLLENLSLDFNSLYTKPCFPKRNIFYAAHKGLILTVHTDGTYKVVNPATKQALELPHPPCVKNAYGEKWINYHAIVNLSCPLSSSACSFVVMRFVPPYKLVDIYNPQTRKWVQCKFVMEDEHLFGEWYLANYVFLGEVQTLFFLTTQVRCMAFQFESLDHEPKICDSYCFSLPEVVRKEFLHEQFLHRTKLGQSQGCMYLSHVKGGIWIWKHCGVSSAANPWILIFEFSKSARLCKPVIEKHLARFYHDGHSIYVMGFHPEVELVYLYVIPSRLFFAYNLANDSWAEIGSFTTQSEQFTTGLAHSYTPWPS